MLLDGKDGMTTWAQPGNRETRPWWEFRILRDGEGIERDPPANVTMIESTEAKIGLLMKKLENTELPHFGSTTDSVCVPNPFVNAVSPA